MGTGNAAGMLGDVRVEATNFQRVRQQADLHLRTCLLVFIDKHTHARMRLLCAQQVPRTHKKMLNLHTLAECVYT